MSLKNFIEKINPEKQNVNIYHVNKTWMYGHKDHRLGDILAHLYSQDIWLADNINDEIKKSGFNLKDPKFIGEIIACWDNPNNKEKRICTTIF
jgi:hypothetical protein